MPTLQQADACLLSVLSSQAKPGTERHMLKPCSGCLSARGASGDPLGRTDSVAAGTGVNAVSVAILPKEPQGDSHGRLDSLGKAGVIKNAAVD